MTPNKPVINKFVKLKKHRKTYINMVILFNLETITILNGNIVSSSKNIKTFSIFNVLNVLE